ncbi:hypothetical protein HPB51_029026 [Rhipicephalus microplus]|uniref:RING-type domain-containing protein n=1 Tax=Rhipicephalus microplus TaxID=6941 RepID=A0A9J6CW15_RHIMP|nr:hypothetical protein HPB51_029026 [Rhipicephalus microplus]
MQRYSVSGFSHELGYRPFHFAEPIPAVRICAVCGLLPQTTTSLPCRHVLCKTCYPQCLVNGICECPLDGDKFLVKDAEWKIFPMKNLLRRKHVKGPLDSLGPLGRLGRFQCLCAARGVVFYHYGCEM